MKLHRPLTDAEDARAFPVGLTFDHPLQHLAFANRKQGTGIGWRKCGAHQGHMQVGRKMRQDSPVSRMLTHVLTGKREQATQSAHITVLPQRDPFG